MAGPVAVVDTSFLVYSAQFRNLDILNKSASLFQYLLFPEEVVKEFTPKTNRPENLIRNSILSKINVSGFYRLCSTKDLIVTSSLLSIPKVDLGEAEAIAQSLSRQVQFILTDDKELEKHLPEKFPNLKFYNSLTIIAIAELLGYIQNYNDYLREYYNIRKFKSKDMREAFEKAMQFTQRHLTKKELSLKTSLSKIL